MENLGEKGAIVFSRMTNKINNGEFDDMFKYPFMNRKMFKVLVKKKILGEEEKGNNPVLSNADIQSIIKDLEEVARETISAFVRAGVLEVKDNEIGLSPIIK